MKNVIRVKDIDSRILEGPYALRLARAATAPYLENGAVCLGVHAAPKDLRDFFLTSIVDETSPDQNDERQKLMVQAGTQYGCSARVCPFCVYQGLKHYRDLKLAEIVDLFRLALFLHGRIYDHSTDIRQLTLKFTDNGEPLNSPNLPEALTQLLDLFGQPNKNLRLKISTVLKDEPLTHQTFRAVVDWQKKHTNQASIHLQISRPSYDGRLIKPSAVAEIIKVWVRANSIDKVCLAPGLTRGYCHESFMAFCEAIKPVAQNCFFRFSVIKPTTKKQKSILFDATEMQPLCDQLVEMGFVVDPLPQSSLYTKELDGAGTLAHLPNGKFYDPDTYYVWSSNDQTMDPNKPLNGPGHQP